MTDSLQLILVLLAAAVGVVVLFRLLHLPAMLGYIIVGILIGPHTLGWLPDAPGTRHLAEFGVVFLMFSIGLEFSLARLRAMQRLVFGLGTAQVVATMLLVMLTSMFFDLGWGAGLALAASSPCPPPPSSARCWSSAPSSTRRTGKRSCACCCSRIWPWCRSSS